eukprot:CFRG5080T1
MAEAHSVSAVFQDTHLHGVEEDFELIHIRQENFQVSYNTHGIVVFIPNPRSIGRRMAKKLYQFRNLIVSSLYPLPIQLAYIITFGFVAFMLGAPQDGWWRAGPVADFVWAFDSKLNPFKDYLPVPVRVGYLSAEVALAVLLIFMYAHRLCLRILLSYQGWMDAPKSNLTFAWGATLKLLYLGGGHKPHTYSFQQALPVMPIPSAKDTVRKYLKSVEPVLTASKYATMKKLADEFLEGNNVTKLQGLLHVKRLLTSNYVSDWWLKYVYLRGRSSLLINSNYYGLGFAFYLPTSQQASRAAYLVHQFVDVKQKLDREQEEPQLINKMVPLCMNQYQYMFSTTRIPHREADEIRRYDSGESKHVVVNYKGLMYKVEVFHKETGDLLSPLHLERSMDYIIQHAERRIASEKFTEAELSVSALTGENRTVWAEARDKHFSAGVNRASLDLIEKSIFVLRLDDAEPETWTQQGKALLHGDGSGIWADKSMTLVVFKNGVAGFNGEHSWGDAPVAAHCWEMVTSAEVRYMPYDPATGRLINNNTEAKEPAQPDLISRLVTMNLTGSKVASAQERKVRVPTPIKFTMNPDLEKVILNGRLAIQKAGDDLHLAVCCFDTFGKDKIKKLKTSPDGFIQMAMQLAYFREANAFPLTYESSMTRLFRDGRTETIRSCTTEAAKFVTAFIDEKVPRAEVLSLLRKACSNHSDISKQAMKGEGIDRHLFALYVASMGLGTESKFLSEALNMKWKLSTSQLPQRQANPECWGGKENQYCNEYLSPSGGFGPVDDSGYGISYNVAGEQMIFFHVSSKRACAETDSDRFADAIKKALIDISGLLDA